MYRRFSVAEANEVLPALLPHVERLMAAWRRLGGVQAEVAARLAARPGADLGGGVLSQAAVDTLTVQDEIAAIRDRGVVVRDPAIGLLDFPAEYEGAPVYLCWRHPEPDVAYWHPVQDGFAGRRRLEASKEEDA